MADTVAFVLEAMVPELEDFHVRGLFTRTEIQRIVAQRTAHEYAMKRRAPDKTDFLRAIEVRRRVCSSTSHTALSLAHSASRLCSTKSSWSHCADTGRSCRTQFWRRKRRRWRSTRLAAKGASSPVDRSSSSGAHRAVQATTPSCAASTSSTHAPYASSGATYGYGCVGSVLAQEASSSPSF